MAKQRELVHKQLKQILEKISEDECQNLWSHKSFWIGRGDLEKFLQAVHIKLRCTGETRLPTHSEYYVNKTKVNYRTPHFSKGSQNITQEFKTHGEGHFANDIGLDASAKYEKKEHVQWEKDRTEMPPCTAIKYECGTLYSEYECQLGARADVSVRIYNSRPTKVGVGVGTGVGVVSGAAGGAGGAVGGVAIGAALGTVVPVVGNIVGGIIGGISGGVLGAVAGGGAVAGIGTGVGFAKSRKDRNVFKVTAKQVFEKSKNQFDDKSNNFVYCTMNVIVSSTYEHTEISKIDN